MSGVFTAVYVLTLSCFGPACGGMPEGQQMVMESQQTCELVRDALERSNDAMHVVRADCHGEAREVDDGGVRLGR